MPLCMFTAPQTLPDDPPTLQLILRAALAEIERLHLQLAGLQRNRFGRRSEKLDDDQIEQGIEDLEQSVAEQQAALDAVADAAAKSSSKPVPPAASRRTQPAKRNRGSLPAHLPRIEMIVDVEDEACPCCGGTMHLIGEDRAEMLDFVPAQLRSGQDDRTRRPARLFKRAKVQKEWRQMRKGLTMARALPHSPAE
jgi:transposase